MNEELKRIRSKDFTAIDQKLYQNLSKADDLTSTLTHLSDFQTFLMEQIKNLNQAPSGAKSTLIAKSIAKNFDDLKESLVKCSRLQAKPQKSLVLSLKEQIDSLKTQLKQTKNGIKQQTRSLVTKNTETIKHFTEQFMSKLQKERKQREQLMVKCQKLQKANADLLQQNEKIRKHALLTRQTSIQLEHSSEKIHVQQKINTLADYRTPLKEVQLFQRQILPSHEQWKITRNQIAVVNRNSQEKRSVSMKRQPSNHEISRKSNLNCFQKQNQLLKAKGVAGQQLKRGKSKQKIKLFSVV